MPTEAQKRAVAKWQREKTDSMKIRFPKEAGREIREQAEREGLSITRYLVRCHVEHTGRAGNPEPGEPGGA